MFPLQKVLNTPKSLLGKLPLNLFVIFHDGHEWNRNLGLLFNTKWRSLDNFSIDHFLRQSKHLTRLLLIYYFQPYYYPRFIWKHRNSLALLYNHQKNVSPAMPSSSSQTFYFQTTILTVLGHSGKQDLLLHPFLNFASFISMTNINSFYWSLYSEQTWSVFCVPGTMGAFM